MLYKDKTLFTYMTHKCEVCNLDFKSNVNLSRHMLTNRHKKQLSNNVTLFKCHCGRSYSHRPSYYRHKKVCLQSSSVSINVEDEVKELKNTIQQEREQHEKERDELRAQIALLLDKHSGTTNNTTNIETQNNTINIHINAFGQENIDYLDEKAIVSCINRIYKSVPAILEKIHFDPEHPENHNIKITNKKLPYASVMGDNQKWKTVDKKDAIETMVFNGYNLLDEKYPETKTELSERKQEHFEGFQNKFEEEDKELRKQLKTDVELLVLNSSI